MPNILQDAEINQVKKKSMEKDEIRNVPCIVQDGNDHGAHISANEINKGNENCMLTGSELTT